MNPASEDPTKISRRFSWVNSHTFKAINNEGIEKIIEIKNGQFKDINQDTIPMLNIKELDGANGYQFYFEPKSYELADTKNRLIRKYMKYNSRICLEQVTDKELLYDTIYEIDYS